MSKMRAQILLNALRKTPQMYCSDKEALLSYISGILSMSDLDFSITRFYNRHLETNGAAWIGLKDDSSKEWHSDEWAHKVIDDALQLIKY